MKQITYKDKLYDIPTDWNEITLGMQIKAEELIKDLGEDLGLIGLISAYTEIPISLIKEGNTAVINEIHQTLAFIYDGYVPEVIEGFVHNDVQYLIKPSFVQNQFQDWLSVQNILNNNKETPMRGLPRLIAVIAKQEGETLDDYDLDEREKVFHSLPLSTAKDVEGFFLSKANELKMITLLSSQEFREELIRMKLDVLKNSLNKLKAQNGRFSLMHLQIGILLIYLTYIKRVLVKYSNSMSSKQSTTNSKTIWQRLKQKLTGRK